jgi:uncharacterized protein
MLIDVNKIKKEGLILQSSVEVDESLLIEDGGHFVNDLSYTVHLIRDGEQRIKAKGEIKTAISLQCVRCTEFFEQKVDSKFDLILFPVGLMQMTNTALKDQDMEYIFYEGDKIDLLKILMEQVNLFIPYNPICGEQCEGICPICGVNLNVESCKCDQSFTDIGIQFDKLKG